MSARKYNEAIPPNGVNQRLLLYQMRDVFGVARVGSVNGPRADRPIGEQVQILFDPELAGGEVATADGIYASHDATKGPTQTRPVLPESLPLPANSWTSLVSWSLAEDQTCTFDLGLRARLGEDSELEAVRVRVSGCAQRPTGENASRENPSISTTPNQLRADLQTSGGTLTIRLKHRAGGTLKISAESTLQVDTL